MENLLVLLKNAFKDFVAAKCMGLVAIALYILYCFSPNKNKKYWYLMSSHRASPNGIAKTTVKKELNTLKLLATDLIRPDKVVPDEVNERRVIVLKKPIMRDGEVVEKGVLLIKFSTTFQYYLRKIDIPLLQKYFQLVLEPSWAGYCLPEIVGWLNAPDKIVVESSEITDYEFIESLGGNLIPVDFGSSDWVNHETFYPINTLEKEYDSLYVSSYKYIKRNHAYLRALAHITQPGYKAALVCNSWGQTKNEVSKLIDYYGIQDKVDVYERLTQPELNELLNKSKVNILLSLKEGSNRSIFEGFFANTPGIVLKANVGVNKAYINNQTGMLIDEKELPKALLHFFTNWQDYSPREWAMDNISIFKTKQKLDAVLEALALEQGMPWTHGTALKVNSPEANFFDPLVKSEYMEGVQITNIFKSNSEEKDISIQLGKLLANSSEA